jgi:hypothetical protein
MGIDEDAKCLLHENILNEVREDTTAIKLALMGTMQEPGFLNDVKNRLTLLESFKKYQIMFIWLVLTSITGIIINDVVSSHGTKVIETPSK